MIVETVRISAEAKNQLIQIKRMTGLEHWNVICRWALLFSLREEAQLVFKNKPKEAGPEIAWKVFAGILDSSLTALVRYHYRVYESKGGEKSTGEFFHEHLHNGISLVKNQPNLQLTSLLRLIDIG